MGVYFGGDFFDTVVVVLAEEVKSLEKLHKSGRIPKKIYEDFKKRLAQAGISPEKAGLTEEDKKVTDEEKALIEKLIADLAGDDWKVREEATKKLTGMGKTVIPFLEKALAGEEIEVRIRAEKIISEIKLELAFGKFRKKLDELNKLVLELVK